jgi:hypothetical protein
MRIKTDKFLQAISAVLQVVARMFASAFAALAASFFNPTAPLVFASMRLLIRFFAARPI